MTQKNFCMVAGIIFLLMTLLHIARLLFGWQVAVGNAVMPMWISWIALVIAAYLAYLGFKFGKSAA